MAQTVECLRCKTVMEEGIVFSDTHGSYPRLIWHRGRPEFILGRGFKINSERLIPMTMLRCPICGYLELYASQPPDAFASD